MSLRNPIISIFFYRFSLDAAAIIFYQSTLKKALYQFYVRRKSKKSNNYFVSKDFPKYLSLQNIASVIGKKEENIQGKLKQLIPPKKQIIDYSAHVHRNLIK